MSGERGFEGAPERSWIERWIAIERGLDRREVLSQAFAGDQATGQHLGDVGHVLRVPPFDLRQGLRGQVEVPERKASLVSDKGAALLPRGTDPDEIVRRRELDMQFE